MIPLPWLILGALLAAGAVGWQGYRMGKDSVIADQAREEKARQETRDIALATIADAIARQKVQRVTIRQETEREIVERPIPAGCVASDRMLELTNAAITGASLPAGPSELPAAGPDDGKDLR